MGKFLTTPPALEEIVGIQKCSVFQFILGQTNSKLGIDLGQHLGQNPVKPGSILDGKFLVAQRNLLLPIPSEFNEF